jgi:hypothetical protein
MGSTWIGCLDLNWVQIGPKMAILGLILTQFSWSDQVDQIDSIGSNWLQKWHPGWIKSCLDLNWVQIGPKMAILGPIWTQFSQSDRVNPI